MTGYPSAASESKTALPSAVKHILQILPYSTNVVLPANEGSPVLFSISTADAVLFRKLFAKSFDPHYVPLPSASS